MTQTKNPHVLETESIGKLLIQYSIPAIIAMTVTSVYNIVDSIFIGHGVGPLAISGLALTFPLMNLIIAFSTLIGVGGAAISTSTLPYARDFMQVLLLGNPVSFLFIGLNNVMRATGYPKKAMLSSLLTVGVNIILAPIFIFHLDWGIRGAATATILAQMGEGWHGC